MGEVISMEEEEEEGELLLNRVSRLRVHRPHESPPLLVHLPPFLNESTAPIRSRSSFLLLLPSNLPFLPRDPLLLHRGSVS